MMSKRTVFGFLVLLSAAVPSLVWGEELTLDQALQEALQANPEIRAASFEAEAAQARISQAKALEDPEVGVEFYQVPIDTANPRQAMETNYMARQKIPFPGKRHVRGKVAKAEAAVKAEGARGRTLDILTDVKKTYFDLYRIERSVEVNGELRDLFRKLVASLKTRYAAGQGTAGPPLRAQVELTRLENEGLKLLEEKVAHVAHMNALLNRQGHEPFSLPRELAFPALNFTQEEVLEFAKVERPELKELDLRRKRDQSRVTQARQGLIPDFQVGFTYNQRQGQQDAWTGSAMVNLPIWFWGKNRGEIREAKAMRQATEAEREAMAAHTLHEIQQEVSTLEATWKRVTNYREKILPASRANLKAARVGYATGKVEFLTLLEASRAYRELAIDYYGTVAGYGQSFARLERLVGRNLSQAENEEGS